MHATPPQTPPAADAEVLASRRNTTWLLAAFVVIGCLLRVPFLGRSVWFDEACMSDQRIGTWEQLLATLYVDIHPPLYVTFMHFWNGLFGDSELSMRMPPLLAGLASIPLVYWAGHRLVGATAALWGALLLALSPVHVWYSAEARLYAPMLASTLVCIGTFDRLLDPATQPKRWLWGLHALNLAVMLSLHYYLATYVVALALAAPALRGFSADSIRLILWHGLGILVLGAFVMGKRALGEFEVSQDYLRAMTLGELYRFVFDWCWTGHTLLAVDNTFDYLAAWTQEALGVAVIALGLHQLWKHRRDDPRGLLVVLGALTIPAFLFVTAAVGLGQTYTERSALPALPFLLLMAGKGIAELPPMVRRFVGTATLLLATASLIALHYFHEDNWTVYKPNSDWRSAAAWLGKEIDQGAAGRPVFTSTPNPRPLTYYDPRIQDVKNLTPPMEASRIGAKVRARLGDALGDYAERTFAAFTAQNARLLAGAALRVYRSAGDPAALQLGDRMRDDVCYLVRDLWHPHPSVDRTIEDLLAHPRVEVIEARRFVGVTVHKVRIKP